MIKRKVTHSEDQGGARWLTTFNDLMTLLLVFFVLLFAMSNIDVKKIKNFQYSLQSGLGVLREGEKVQIAVIERVPIENIEYKAQKITEDSIRALDTEPGVGIAFTDKGILITLEESFLFRSGIADIDPGGLPLLDKIADVIRKTSNPIRVEGHTDNNKINTDRFPSNWELSIARAVNVVKYLVEAGKIPPHRLSAVGYGESRPIFPNDTPQHRAGNRRVEILLASKNKN